MHRINLILSEIGPEDHVLDIGCADHSSEKAEKDIWLHKHLYKKTDHVLGMDILQSEVDKLCDMGYNVTQGNAEEFDLGKKFDVINAGELIEHLSNPGRFLERCKEHLKDGGKLILTAPNAWYLPYMISVLLRGRPPLNFQHTCWYDQGTLTQLLERHGFKVKKLVFVKASQGEKAWRASHILYKLRMKQLGGENIFLVCEKGN